MPLTKRQSEILAYLQSHIHGQGYAPSFEEIAEQFGGFGLERALLDGYGVVEAAVCGCVVEGTCVTGLGVGGGVDEAVDAGGVGGAGAHGAGFQGGV